MFATILQNYPNFIQISCKMINKRFCFKLIVLFLILPPKCNAETSESDTFCYSSDRQNVQTRKFSTKTSYPKTAATTEIQRHKYELPNCKSVKIWLLIRHGTRLPTDKEVVPLQKLNKIRDEIIYNVEKSLIKSRILSEASCVWNQNSTIAKSYLIAPAESDLCKKRTGRVNPQMCREDIELIRNWTLNPLISVDKASFLSPQGWNDINGLAINFKESFPHLFEPNFSNSYRFLHTRTQRNEEGFKAFLRGLFGKKAFKKMPQPIIPQKELLLKPYEYCNVTKKNSDMIEEGQDSELWRYKMSPIFSQMVREVSERLNLPRQLSVQEIGHIWDMCRYDQSWNLNQPSSWCSAFTPLHIDILEYSEDLRYYYKSCHGHRLNRNLPCLLIQDMLSHINNEKNPKVIAYFAHSTMLHLLLAAFDAVKDPTPLKWDNSHEMQTRKFRSSRHAPFAANLALVHYECPNEIEKHKIGVFLNEMPLNLDWCNVNICNVSSIRSKFAAYTNCDEFFCPKL